MKVNGDNKSWLKGFKGVIMHLEILDTFHPHLKEQKVVCSNDGCFNGNISEFLTWVRAHAGNFADIKLVEPFNGHCEEITFVDNKGINYRELLKKYIGHVGEVEGVSFINPDNNEGAGPCGKAISREEWEELIALDTEAEKQYYKNNS